MTTPDRIADVPAQRVIGANASYTKDTRGGIPDQWADWDYKAVTGVNSDEVYGVCHNFAPGMAFDYLCGLPVSDDAVVPEGQIEVMLPAGQYAVYVHNGHVSGMAALFDAVFSGPGPGSGLTFSYGPQFEVYGDGFDPITATGRVEIWFPVARVS